jgi:hypothetical protein
VQLELFPNVLKKRIMEELRLILVICRVASMDASQGRRRVQITTTWLASLKNSYDIRFAKYCEGRSNPVQRIPTRVWQQVFSDFLKEAEAECEAKGQVFDEKNYPTERTLQDSLRGFLTSLGTGTSDSGTGETVSPRSDDNLQRIRMSDAHARRSMNEFRENLIAEGETGRSDAPKRPRTESRLDVQKKAVQTLEKMTETMEENNKRISRAMEDSSNRMSGLLESQTELSKKKHALKCLSLLYEQKIIDREEYTTRARKLLPDV